MQGKRDDTDYVEGCITVRSLLLDIFDVASREGIVRQMRKPSLANFDALCTALEKDPGYDLSKGNRRRMIAVLLDLYKEVGRSALQDDEAFWKQVELSARLDDAQLFFFRECLRHVPAYLRGGPSSLEFDKTNIGIWDRFLGCPSFRSCRKLLLELMDVEDSPSFHLLDLCHGPGWGLVEAVGACPAAHMTAVDFTDSFARMARKRVYEANAAISGAGPEGLNIRWIDSGQWKGFGSPLPLEDSEFDAVLFCCADPYIPALIRKDVYREISRVLSPGGRLGILTRGYPDPARRHVSSAGMRIASLVHDFSESVCCGWAGFSDPGENAKIFHDLGYREGANVPGSTNFLEGSLWVLRKGA